MCVCVRCTLIFTSIVADQFRQKIVYILYAGDSFVVVSTLLWCYTPQHLDHIINSATASFPNIWRFNSLMPKQNGQLYANDIFKYFFFVQIWPYRNSISTGIWSPKQFLISCHWLKKWTGDKTSLNNNDISAEVYMRHSAWMYQPWL